MTSMANEFKKPDIVVEIKMRRTAHKGAFLVVEGGDDRVFWDTRRHNSCGLLVAGGKSNVVKAIQRLDEDSFSGALGVVDCNLDHFAGADLGSKNLVATDAHDLECVLCRSSALDKVLAEHGDPEKIHRFAKISRTDVRAALLVRAVVFGQLRRAAQRSVPAIGLQDIHVSRFVDESMWRVNEEALIKAMAEVFRCNITDLRDRIRQLPLADPWYVANGHDMVEILRIGLKKVLGSIKNSVGRDRISELLRAGMSPIDLKRTKLWEGMRFWEAANVPYLVLAD